MNKLFFSIIAFTLASCVTTLPTPQKTTPSLPKQYNSNQDTAAVSLIKWSQFYGDSNLLQLIEAGLKQNQERSIAEQEVLLAQLEIRSRKGEYLPFVGVRTGFGLERISENSWRGAVESNLDVRTKEKALRSSSDLSLGIFASWEVDVWKKLRRAKKAAVSRYLATIEGRNFITTNLIAEIANSYYELIALDNQLQTINQNIALQERALQGVQLQKESAKLTQLAVNRFEAQLLNTQNYQYVTRQAIVETENRIRFLIGDHARLIRRIDYSQAESTMPDLSAGNPSQLLANRPDIRQAEKSLEAASLDVQAARANFNPSIRLEKFMGTQAFSPQYLFNPASLIYTLATDLAAPLVNRNNIHAIYQSAGAHQTQALLTYGQRVLNAYLEVSNELARADNLKKSYETKSREVDILLASIGISNSLFQSARADYIEVLLTQEEALQSKLELIEIQLSKWKNKVQLYRSLGGGWE